MGVHISGKYLGDLKVELSHGPSDYTIETDAPVDNGGTGSCFSPTDLLTASYSACMMTIIGLRAKPRQLDLKGLRIDAEKIMTSSAPRRIAEIRFRIHFPYLLKPEDREWLMDEAKACPVALSVHPDIKTVFDFQ